MLARRRDGYGDSCTINRLGRDRFGTFVQRTRNARRLERRFQRAFIGVGRVADIVAAVPVIRGLKASVGGDPFAWSDFEAALVIDGFDRFEAVMGIHGVNPTDRRRIFTT